MSTQPTPEQLAALAALQAESSPSAPSAGIHTDQNGDPSSKRVYGGVMVGCGSALLMTLGVLAIFRAPVAPDVAKDCAQTLLITGASLLGVSVLEFFAVGKK